MSWPCFIDLHSDQRQRLLKAVVIGAVGQHQRESVLCPRPVGVRCLHRAADDAPQHVFGGIEAIGPQTIQNDRPAPTAMSPGWSFNASS